MRVRAILLGAASIVGAFVAPLNAQPAPSSVPGEVVVTFVRGATLNAKADAHRQAGATPRAEIASTGVQLVTVPAGLEVTAIARYRANANVVVAEPNYIRTIPRPMVDDPPPVLMPRDHYFGEQWALHNTGQLFYCIAEGFCLYIGTPDADIDAPEAWGRSTGTSSARVAVIDSGIDRTHIDLAGKYVGGYDYIFNDSDPADDHGHGTHVAGTIAALLDNATGDPANEEGVVGVAPNAQILAYKVCRSDGTCSDFAMQQAIAQSVIDGAHVINMSIGGAAFSQSLNNAVQNAWNAGVVVVAAAGNNGSTVPSYPAAFNNVVSVGAFDEDHRRASFSNYGNWVDISAPGNAVMSTYLTSECGGGVGGPGDMGCYAWLSGTSMASPHVAGAAALLRSLGVSASQTVSTLLESADPQGRDAVRLDSWTIHGGLNLSDAVGLIIGNGNVAPVANAGPDQTATADASGSAQVTLDGSLSNDADGSIVNYEWLENNASFASGATANHSFAVGTHSITLRVTDNEDETATDIVIITVNPANVAPLAVPTNATTVVGSPVTVALGASDAGTCELTFVVGAPSGGSLSALTNQPCLAGTPNTDTAQVTYTPPSTPGTYTFTYQASDGDGLVSNATTVTVTVNDAPPQPTTLTVAGITPPSVSQNAGTLDFVITGTGFVGGATVAFVNGSGGQTPRVLGVTFNSSMQLTARVQLRPGGPKRNRTWDVRVTNPDGTSTTGVRLLTITP